MYFSNCLFLNFMKVFCNRFSEFENVFRELSISKFHEGISQNVSRVSKSISVISLFLNFMKVFLNTFSEFQNVFR